MAIILHIDTATGQASVSLGQDGNLLNQRVNSRAMDHAAWIHTAIREMTGAGNTVQLSDLSAVAVIAGPGSYTGLRVGMATAKGLCYALRIPLISINTLEVMARAIKKDASPSSLLCPMLDARRMEVFTALYENNLQELVSPCAMILEKTSFSTWLDARRIIFAGNGSSKWRELVKHDNALFSDVQYSAKDITTMANEVFNQQSFADIAYTDPIYLKEFYSYPK